VANLYRVVVGRLVEVRLDCSIRTVQDVNEWFAGFAAAAARRPAGSLAVVAADWRSCPLLSVDAAEAARQRLAGTNPHVERSAALAAPDSAVTVLQFLRLCRDSGHENRRMFKEPQAMISWLGQVLSRPERLRLAEFIAEVPVQQTPRSARQA
jgi:hypothetical protein